MGGGGGGEWHAWREGAAVQLPDDGEVTQGLGSVPLRLGHAAVHPDLVQVHHAGRDDLAGVRLHWRRGRAWKSSSSGTAGFFLQYGNSILCPSGMGMGGVWERGGGWGHGALHV